MSQLYRYDSNVDGSLDFSSWAAFTASALEVGKLGAAVLGKGCADAWSVVTVCDTTANATWLAACLPACLAHAALQVTKLNAISMLSGLAVVVVNWLVTVAVRKVSVSCVLLYRWLPASH
jgi:hypothetical protein